MAERPQRFVGAATVAEWIGVSSGAITVYRKRYADTTVPGPCPEPDIVVTGERDVPGWSPDREDEWRRWNANRVGQGAGGGRPPGRRESAVREPETRAAKAPTRRAAKAPKVAEVKFSDQ
ncbi:hypothetical protein ACFY19_20800 [Streptosporangium saharense]|uniref:hypothetical protein n=1 Tax=Streptosporangium saharense TaxID=1706840 RepID=UPI0036B8CE63